MEKIVFFKQYPTLFRHACNRLLHAPSSTAGLRPPLPMMKLRLMTAFAIIAGMTYEAL
jgi:hypothetical protein